MEKGKDDSSSEAYVWSSETIKGYFLDQEISNFVKLFEFYLVTESL